MLGTADLAHKRQIPGPPLAADRSALVSEGASGLLGAACSSQGEWDGGRKEKKTPERLRGSGGPAWWQQEHGPSPPAFLLRLLCEGSLLFPRVLCRQQLLPGSQVQMEGVVRLLLSPWRSARLSVSWRTPTWCFLLPVTA